MKKRQLDMETFLMSNIFWPYKKEGDRIMNIVQKCILTTVGAATLTMSANADITMNIWDDGVNLYMSATGTYDMTNATSSNSYAGLGANALMWASTEAYGWETWGTDETSQGFVATYTGLLTGGDSSPTATTVSTTNPFFFANLSSEIYFESTASLTGSVDELAIFSGATLASLGMVAGETVIVSWGNGGLDEGGTINVLGAIPAPGALALLGLAGLATRRRRS
jgi:MYXO-CTERM domain-containing protein